MNIEILGKHDERVQTLILRLLEMHPAPTAILFGGDRWQYIDCVAIASEDGEDIGLASLAPKGEDGRSNTPEIVGVFILPGHRRQGVGLALVRTLSEECQKKYDKKPGMDAVTHLGSMLAKRVKQAGLADVRYLGISMDF